MAVFATTFHNYKHAARIFFDYRQGATGCLQQRRQLSFNKAMLFIRIADVSEWRTHVKRSACLALKQNVIAAKMDLSRFPCSR
jgi:hypothetical protein